MTAPYRHLATLSSAGCLEISAMFDTVRGKRCVGIAMTPSLAETEVDARLDAIARAHRAARGPGVPGVLDDARIAGRRHIVLDCDAVMDADGLVGRLDAARTRVPHAVGAALIDRTRAAIMHAHEHVDPRSGAPVVLGVLTGRNILLSEEGNLYVVGFGTASFALELGCALPIAPELVAGADATIRTDSFAMLCYARSVMRFVTLAPLAARAHAGFGGPVESKIRQFLQAGNSVVWAGSPALRPTPKTGSRIWRAVWRLAGVRPDYEGMRAVVSEHASAAAVPTYDRTNAKPLRVRLARDGVWVQGPDGTTIDLSNKPVLRRLTLALHDAKLESRKLDVWALSEIGWPGERAKPEAVQNRVYVALSRLRTLGLRDVIERVEDGYWIPPHVSVDLD